MSAEEADAFVSDANVLIEWLTREPATTVGQAARRAAERGQIVGPPLLWAEVAHNVTKKARGGELTSAQRTGALRGLDILGLELDDAGQRQDVLTLALRHDFSVYDAFYLEVALRRRFPLATNDRALRRAATAEGVPLV